MNFCISPIITSFHPFSTLTSPITGNTILRFIKSIVIGILLRLIGMSQTQLLLLLLFSVYRAMSLLSKHIMTTCPFLRSLYIHDPTSSSKDWLTVIILVVSLLQDIFLEGLCINVVCFCNDEPRRRLWGYVDVLGCTFCSRVRDLLHRVRGMEVFIELQELVG